jgi:hypothetical protein
MAVVIGEGTGFQAAEWFRWRPCFSAIRPVGRGTVSVDSANFASLDILRKKGLHPHRESAIIMSKAVSMECDAVERRVDVLRFQRKRPGGLKE